MFVLTNKFDFRNGGWKNDKILISIGDHNMPEAFCPHQGIRFN